MTRVFQKNEGHVTKIILPGQSLPGMMEIQVTGNNPTRTSSVNRGLSTSNLVVITGVSVEQSANVQFSRSLGDLIYLYSFGDKMGTIIIKGILFEASCQQAGNTNGVTTVLDFWDSYKVSSRTSNNQVPTVSLRYGGRTLKGYLTDCRVQSMNPSNLMSEFQLVIRTASK